MHSISREARRRLSEVAALCAIVATSGVLATASPASAAVVARGTYTPVDPARILDTRSGLGVAATHPGSAGVGEVTELAAAGVGGVPDTGVGAVVLNITVTAAPGPGYVTVYPCGEPLPLASNVNFTKGVDVANQVTAKLGAGGRVCLYASRHSELVADVSGWYADGVVTVPGVFYHDLDPTRVIDTRVALGTGERPAGPLAAGEILPFTFPGVAGVPADGARAVTLNVTVDQASAPGYLTVFPCDRPRPEVSNVNFDPANSTVANLATVRLSSTGQVCFFGSVGTQLIVDVQGYFASAPAAVFTGITPTRVLDTRDGTGIVGTHPARRGDVVQLDVRSWSSVPADAAAVMLNVTITGADGPGYVTAFPCGGPHPVASFLNFMRGVDRANLTPVRVNETGKVCLYVSNGSDVVADLDGYYSRTA